MRVLSVSDLLKLDHATTGYKKSNAGYYRVPRDGKDNNGESLASGVYLYRMETDGFVQMRKLILMR